MAVFLFSEILYDGCAGSGPVFNVGDSVEYFGVSQGRWIPAKAICSDCEDWCHSIRCTGSLSDSLWELQPWREAGWVATWLLPVPTASLHALVSEQLSPLSLRVTFPDVQKECPGSSNIYIIIYNSDFLNWYHNPGSSINIIIIWNRYNW